MSLKKPDINTSPRANIKEEIYGTKYPYFDYNETLYSSISNKLLRAVSFINPFAFKQVSDEDSLGFSALNGNIFAPLEAYPNSVGWGRWMPAHFDPVNDGPKEDEPLLGGVKSHTNGHKISMRQPMIPRGCSRQFKAFDRCKMINGADKCTAQVKNVMEICPTWALEKKKEAKRFYSMVAALQTKEYRQAMTLSSYNEGKTVADVSGKTYIHGGRKFLRPDSIWADSRYTEVTLEEIEEAKARHNERQAHGHHAAHDHHHANSDYVINHADEKPLYP